MYKIKFPKKMYKTYATKERYLKQLYKMNKAYFDAKIEGYGEAEKYTRFKDLIRQQQENPYLRVELNMRKGQKVSVKEAAKAIVRTRMFTPSDELAIENLMQGLKKNKQISEVYDKLGKNKIYKKNFVYDAKEKTFKYIVDGQEINISFQRYPKGSKLMFDIS